MVSRTQSETSTLDVVKRKEGTSSRPRSEMSQSRKLEQKHPRSESRRSDPRSEKRHSDQLASAEEVARRVVSGLMIFILYGPVL